MELYRRVRTGVIVGAVGAIANWLAIAGVKAAGLKPGTGGLARVLLRTTLSAPEAALFHLAMGIGMATAYVVVVRDLLPGPGWLRGLIFAQVPSVLQLFWVLPAVGAGMAGRNISPATPYLAWSLNAFFGVVIGLLAPPRIRVKAHERTPTNALV